MKFLVLASLLFGIQSFAAAELNSNQLVNHFLETGVAPITLQATAEGQCINDVDREVEVAISNLIQKSIQACDGKFLFVSDIQKNVVKDSNSNDPHDPACNKRTVKVGAMILCK